MDPELTANRDFKIQNNYTSIEKERHVIYCVDTKQTRQTMDLVCYAREYLLPRENCDSNTVCIEAMKLAWDLAVDPPKFYSVSTPMTDIKLNVMLENSDTKNSPQNSWQKYLYPCVSLLESLLNG